MSTTVREVLAEHYGDWFSDDGRRNSLSHVIGVHVKKYDGEAESCITFNHAIGRAYYGYDDPGNVANYRVLSDWWESEPALTRSPYNDGEYIALALDKPAPDNLLDVIESLGNYPVLDDDEYFTVEEGMILEHWEDYGESDTIDAVAKAIGVDPLDISDQGKQTLKALVFSGVVEYGYGGGYPYLIDVSAVEFGNDAIAEYVGEHYGTVVMIKDPYRELAFDLTAEGLLDK